MPIDHDVNERVDRLTKADPRLDPLLDEIRTMLGGDPYQEGRHAFVLLKHLEALNASDRDAYDRGRADKEREIAEARAAALMATMEEPGGLQPYEGSQVSSGLDVDTAGADELRNEVRRLDLRLRWILRHYDDALTSHMFLQDEMYQKGIADGVRQEQHRAGQVAS